MAAHFATEQGAGFFHLGLDQRVAGLPHDRASAGLADDAGQLARALHVKDDVGARVTGNDVLGKQHHQAVGVDQLALVGNKAEAVGIAVKGNAQVGAAALDHLDQVGKVLRLTRVRVMVGEQAIDIAVQRNDVAADAAEQAFGNDAADTVAAIDDHLERAGDDHVVHDLLQVAVQHVQLVAAAVADAQVVLLQALVQGRDLVAREGLASDHDLQAVVGRRVVAAGDHHAGGGAAGVGGKVQHGGGHHADVADLAAAVHQPLNQLFAQCRAGQAAITGDQHTRLAGIQ